jgi:hypothetical protein
MRIVAMEQPTRRRPARGLGPVAIITVFVVCAVACGNPAAAPSHVETPPPAGEPSASGSATCASGAEDCLAWDDFDGEPGTIERAPSGQAWETWGASFCPTCLPIFTTDGSRASMAPGADNIQIWFATLDTDHATGISVSADITMSPTPLRANVGLIALFVDLANHLSCKIEVSELHPAGLLTFGDVQHDVPGFRLAPLQHLGLKNGSTYHLVLTVPSSLADEPMRCEVSGEGIETAEVEYQLTPAMIAAYGGGTKQGLRLHITSDEDDGGSMWDNFEVREIA